MDTRRKSGVLGGEGHYKYFCILTREEERQSMDQSGSLGMLYDG